MPRKTLTEKQQKTAELVGAGKEQLDSIQEVYHCNRPCAYQLSHKLKENELYQKEVNKIRNIKTGIIRDEGKRLAQIINELFPPRERAELLIKLARESKKESIIMEALKEISKLSGEYPQVEPEKIDLGGLHLTMIQPAEEIKRLKGKIIEQKSAQESAQEESKDR